MLLLLSLLGCGNDPKPLLATNTGTPTQTGENPPPTADGDRLGQTLLLELTTEDREALCDEFEDEFPTETVVCEDFEYTPEWDRVSCLIRLDFRDVDEDDCRATVDDVRDCNDAVNATDPCDLLTEAPPVCAPYSQCLESQADSPSNDTRLADLDDEEREYLCDDFESGFDDEPFTCDGQEMTPEYDRNECLASLDYDEDCQADVSDLRACIDAVRDADPCAPEIPAQCDWVFACTPN